MIRELAPGHPLDLTDRVAVVAVVADGGSAARAAAEGADVVLVPSEVRTVPALLDGVGGPVPVVDALAPLDAADQADLVGLGPDEATALTVAAVASGVRVLRTDDVRTVRRAADVAVAVRSAAAAAGEGAR